MKTDKVVLIEGGGAAQIIGRAGIQKHGCI
jgi:hypothetical protein